jgi:hypothetical protein
MAKNRLFRRLLIAVIGLFASAHLHASEPGLISYWNLRGDARDSSGHGHHGSNHGVNLQTGEFNGKDSYIEVPSTAELQFGGGDFSVASQVFGEKELADVIGDLLSKFDPAPRRGFNLTFNCNTSGYNAQSNVRSLFFGIDASTTGEWSDCGRPGGNSHSSDALTVFQGDLYAGTTDAPTEADWAHVFRYRGGRKWEDCGRLGSAKTRGVYALVVHDGALYAGTSSEHGSGSTKNISPGSVYRYQGGQQWEDIGQPGEQFRMNSLASFRGKLYVCGITTFKSPGYVYVYEGNKRWKISGEFNGRPHCMAVHDGRLYAAYPQGEVYAFDGTSWQNLGNPLGSYAECNQIHSLGIFRGELYIGSWPKGRVAVLRGGKRVDLGRLGDATEVIGLCVYNGSFYAATIPRAEVFRFDGPGQWTSIRRLFDPPDFKPVPVGSGAKEVRDWSRASSLSIFQGKMFVSTATCYRTNIDPPLPAEMRGKVYSFATGSAVSHDQDLGPGWKSVAAVRGAGKLKLYVDGKMVASSVAEPINISNDAPLHIGNGPQSYFNGKIREVRVYNRALGDEEIRMLSQKDTATR